MKVEIYSDGVCPWRFSGERRFMRALAERLFEELAARSAGREG